MGYQWYQYFQTTLSIRIRYLLNLICKVRPLNKSCRHSYPNNYCPLSNLSTTVVILSIVNALYNAVYKIQSGPSVFSGLPWWKNKLTSHSLSEIFNRFSGYLCIIRAKCEEKNGDYLEIKVKWLSREERFLEGLVDKTVIYHWKASIMIDKLYCDKLYLVWPQGEITILWWQM